MGISKWKSEIELWLDKTNQTSELPVENEAIVWENIMEPIFWEHFSKVTGKPVREVKAILQHPEYPFMFADLDYMFERFLERLSVSEYSEKIVVKGGIQIHCWTRYQIHNGFGYHFKKFTFDRRTDFSSTKFNL